MNWEQQAHLLATALALLIADTNTGRETNAQKLAKATLKDYQNKVKKNESH